MNKTKAVQAGKIASKVREQARAFIKPGMKLLEIAEKSTRLSERDKYFTSIFLDSPLMHAL